MSGEPGKENDLEEEDTVETLYGNIDISRNEEGRFGCSKCTASFSRKHDMKRHLEAKHELTFADPENTAKSFICGECNSTFSFLDKLRNHLKTIHNLKMNIEELSFPSLSHFNTWKNELEENTSTTYSKERGSRNVARGGSMLYYKCNRSGTYMTHGSGKRRMKSSGTCKIGVYCTSGIRAHVLCDGRVDVQICHTHYGHAIELEHIRLTKRQRNEIATRLSQGVSGEKILDSIKNEVGPVPQRIHLLGRKDINNIRRYYGIESTSDHDYEQPSVLGDVDTYKNKDKSNHDYEQPSVLDDIDAYKNNVKSKLDLIGNSVTSLDVTSSESLDAIKHLDQQLTEVFNTFERTKSTAFIPPTLETTKRTTCIPPIHSSNSSCPSACNEVLVQSTFQPIQRKRMQMNPKLTQENSEVVSALLALPVSEK